MVWSRKYKGCGFGAAFFLANIILFSILSLYYVSGDSNDGLQQKRKEVIVGSVPPLCANKCLNCKPCLASLFDIRGVHDDNHDDDDDGKNGEPYYPVTWKCRCRNKLFEP